MGAHVPRLMCHAPRDEGSVLAGLLATSTQTSHFWRASLSLLGAWVPPSLVRGVPRTQYRLRSLVSSGGETGPRGMCETQPPSLPCTAGKSMAPCRPFPWVPSVSSSPISLSPRPASFYLGKSDRPTSVSLLSPLWPPFFWSLTFIPSCSLLSV